MKLFNCHLLQNIGGALRVKLLTEDHLDFLSLKGVAQARMSLHLSKCHIVGNHMLRLIYDGYMYMKILCNFGVMTGLQIKVLNWQLFCLFLKQNIICCGYSKQPSQWGGSFEHQNILKFMSRVRKITIVYR